MLNTFRFRWIPFIVTMIVVVTGILLGQWQMGRATQKQEIETKLLARKLASPVVLDGAVPDISEVEYRRVLVKGEFVHNWPVYLDNRPYKGAAGLYVLMPLKITGSNRYVLVARGWIHRNIADRAKLPSITIPTGILEIEGIVRRNPGHLLQLGRAADLRPGAIVQNVTIDEFAKASKLPMQPLFVEQLNDTQDALIRDWPSPSSGIEKHLGYAFQWYALAGMAFIFFVVTGLRRGTK